MGRDILSVYGTFFLLAAVLNLVGERRAGVEQRPELGERRQKMRVKYLTYLAVTAVVLGSAAIHPLAFALIVAVILLTCLDELLVTLGGLRPLGLLLGALLIAAALLGDGRFLAPCLGAAALVSLAVGTSPEVSRAAWQTLVAVVYIPFLGSHLLLLIHQGQVFGPIAFFYMSILVGDCMAMLGGQLWGRRRPWRVSPNKTLEGSAVSLISVLVTAFFLRSALPEHGLPGVLTLALAIGVAAQLGDLVASSFKRDAGVKDYGTWLPTFGGMLDRFDSFIFAAPVFYFLTHFSSETF